MKFFHVNHFFLASPTLSPVFQGNCGSSSPPAVAFLEWRLAAVQMAPSQLKRYSSHRMFPGT